MFSLLIFSTLVAALIVTAYLYVKNVYSYWKRKGVPFIKPIFPFGNIAVNFFQKKSFSDTLRELYNSSDEPVLGVYALLSPGLLIRDPKIVQDILIKDFSSFHDRGLYIDEKMDPMANNLLLQRGDKWKHLRSKLSPAFTSGKLKGMFETIVDCGESLEEYFNGYAKSNETIDVRDVFARFMTTVIASVAFGIDADCIANPDSEFRIYGKKVFEPSFRHVLRNIAFMNPRLTKLFRVRFTDADICEFMIETVRQNLEYREKNNVSRKDFFQLLIQLRNTGDVQSDNDWSTKSKSINGGSLSLEDMAAQAFLFFAGGFESSSTTMSFCMYELAKNPDVQQKAYEEIKKVLEENNGQLTYESAMEMKYTENCIDETLRKYPPFAAISRQCTKDYQLANSNIVIDKGTPIIIPSTGLQYDSKYYHEPEEFKPERFNEENTRGKTFIDMPELWFGAGPRNCIGLRLAKMQTILAIVLLLQKFKFELGDTHKGKPLIMNPKSRITAPLNGINLKVSFRG